MKEYIMKRTIITTLLILLLSLSIHAQCLLSINEDNNSYITFDLVASRTNSLGYINPLLGFGASFSRNLNNKFTLLASTQILNSRKIDSNSGHRFNAETLLRYKLQNIIFLEAGAEYTNLTTKLYNKNPFRVQLGAGIDYNNTTLAADYLSKDTSENHVSGVQVKTEYKMKVKNVAFIPEFRAKFVKFDSPFANVFNATGTSIELRIKLGKFFQKK